MNETIRSACSRVSTIGTMIPSAPASSMRATKWYSVAGTRTNGGRPMPRQEANCAFIVSTSAPLCSMS